MEKKNVADVIKEIIPVAVDIISDKLSKEDNNDNATVGLVIDNNGDVHNIESKELNDTVNDVHELAVGLIKYKPINKITESMNERGLSDEEKVRESYSNGFCDGFMLANFAQQHHIDHTYEKLSDINETIETAKYLIEQKFE
jgi:hypothetical protein